MKSLQVDAAVLEHLEEARVGLARAVAVDAALRIDHALHRFEGELRDVFALVRVHRRDRLAQVDVAEGDVARLVAQHVLGQAAQQRAGGVAAHVVERSQRQALDDHVHADQDLGVVVRRQRRVDQLLQPRRDRVDDRELACT